MNKIVDLMDRLEMVRQARIMEQETPVDDLSRSLFEMGRELAGLDTIGKSALLYELNHGDPLEGTMGANLSMKDLERLVSDYTEV